VSAKHRAWCALCSIWIRGDPNEWVQIEHILAEAQGTCLLMEALYTERVGHIVLDPQFSQPPRLIGDDP